MRWAFLFLVLANAVMLFWYATTQPRDDVEPSATGDEHALVLVSEVPGSQLVARVDPVRVGLDALAAPESISCFVIGETDHLITAQRIMNFFSERGHDALINQRATPVTVGYELMLEAPAGDGARLQMLDRLDRLGVIPESRLISGRLYFVAGIYESEAEAAQMGARMSAQQLIAQQLPLSVDEWSYSVQINGPFDQKTSRKISEIVKKAYPAIKIEKKLCKGVASTQGGH